jgi:hypothetical protein
MLRSGYAMVVATVLSTALAGGAWGEITVTESAGGSVRVYVSPKQAFNPDSSLQRRWVVLNDSTSGVRITRAGIATVWADDRLTFKSGGALVAEADVSAIEVRFLLFDMWDRHIVTLSGNGIHDLQAGETLDLATVGPWRAWLNAVQKYLTCVIFVAHVRLEDGRVWSFDEESLLPEIAALFRSVRSTDLEPEHDFDLLDRLWQYTSHPTPTAKR